MSLTIKLLSHSLDFGGQTLKLRIIVLILVVLTLKLRIIVLELSLTLKLLSHSLRIFFDFKIGITNKGDYTFKEVLTCKNIVCEIQFVWTGCCS